MPSSLRCGPSNSLLRTMMPSLVLLRCAVRRLRQTLSRSIASATVVTWAVLMWAVSAHAAEPKMPAEITGFVTTHCLDCHQGKEAEAGLNLQTFPLDLSKPHLERRWLQIVDRVATGEMPPADWGKVDANTSRPISDRRRRCPAHPSAGAP